MNELNVSKQNEIEKIMADIEYFQVSSSEKLRTSEYMRIPITTISALGSGLTSLSDSFRTITQTVEAGGTETLYRAVFKDGISGKLLDSKDGIGKLGTILKDGGGFAQARFVEVMGNTATISTTMPFNPAMLFVAAALMDIEKQLSDIKKTQQEIFEFLKEDKKAKLKGNITFLADILSNYKYNWDNMTYKTNMHIKVQDIKQDAEQNIEFYRKQIQKKLGRHSLLTGEQNIKNEREKLQTEFVDYQLAVYLHGFSSFLEVMLLGNFDAGYLDSIINKIEQYSYQYRELYTESYNQLEDWVKSSVQSHLRDGLANISGIAGNAVAKIPVVNKSQIDEVLIGASERLNRYNLKKTGQIMEQFISSQCSHTRPFIESINVVNRLYNCPMEVFFDRENVYLCQAEE